MSALRRVDADLMRASGVGKRLEQAKVADALQHLEARFRFLALDFIDDHPADLVRVGGELELAVPLRLLRRAAHDHEVSLLHLPRLEQIADRIDGSAAAGHEENARRLGVEPVDVLEELDPARARPEGALGNRGDDGGVQIAIGLLPRIGHEHPAGGLVHGDDGAVLVQDGDARAVAEFDVVGLGQGFLKRET